MFRLTCEVIHNTVGLSGGYKAKKERVLSIPNLRPIGGIV